MKDMTIGDRMKLLEGEEAKRKFMPVLPICVRLDGKSFHSFCKGLKRPFDKRLSELMVDTTKFLVEESNALVGYTQSDEITLIIYSEDYKSQVYFDGRIQKIVSVLSSAATAFFNSKLSEYLPEKANLLPKFDCRAWQVPNKVEAVNVLVWREQDAIKNSISMAAQQHIVGFMLGKYLMHIKWTQELLWFPKKKQTKEKNLFAFTLE